MTREVLLVLLQHVDELVNLGRIVRDRSRLRALGRLCRRGCRGGSRLCELGVCGYEVAREGCRVVCEPGAGGDDFGVDLNFSEGQSLDAGAERIAKELTLSSFEFVSMHSFRQVARKST